MSGYLVAAHVVTLVHDHRFAALVVLPDIQTGFRALVLNLRQTPPPKKIINVTFVLNLLDLDGLNMMRVCLTAPYLSGVRSGMKASG